ncbi:MAG: hypothetical protein HZC03_01390 [Candidatus Lloydbacteria bacterium]|nr:hypothetical protein [Candidatus Lloydbacteria bacterium]
MQKILIFKMLSYKLPALAALATTIAIFFWPALPLRGIANWLVIYANTPYLTFLYPAIAILSGIYMGLYIYNKNVAPCCSIETIKGGAAGSFVGVLLGACPACIPVIAIFLPLAFNVFLSRIAPIFSLISIVILLWVIYRMNGFRRFV